MTIRRLLPCGRRARWPLIGAATLVCALLLLSGCGGAREAASTTPPAREAVADGIRYHVPPGWRDFSRDTLRTGAIWLVRGDLQASVAIDEVQATDPVNELSAADGLLALERAGGAVRVVAAPARQQWGSVTAAVYRVRRGNGEEVRTAVVLAHGTLYALTALQRRGNGEEFDQLMAVQESLAADLVR